MRHQFRGIEWLRLFLSYQRYGFMLTIAALSPLALVWALAPTTWWAWALAAVPCVWIGKFAIFVLGRFPRKLRLTAIAQRRIAQGSFSPRSVATYCEDPCFRVLAHEILRRAGLPATERRSLIQQLQAEASANASGLMIFDHERGTVTHIDGQGHRHEPTSHSELHARPSQTARTRRSAPG